MSKLDVYQIVKYTDSILTGPDLNKWCALLLALKDTCRGYTGNKWIVGLLKYSRVEKIFIWSKVYGLYSDGDPISGEDWFDYFKKYLWLDLVNLMWKKHQYDFQYHMKYIHNNLVKPFSLILLQYYNHIN